MLPLVLPGEGGELVHVFGDVLLGLAADVPQGLRALVGQVGDQLLAVFRGSGVARGPGLLFSAVVSRGVIRFLKNRIYPVFRAKLFRKSDLMLKKCRFTLRK